MAALGLYRRSHSGPFRWAPVLVVAASLAATTVEAQQLQLLSKRSGGASDSGGGASAVVVSSLSADGRYLVFTSVARNLAPGQVDANFTLNDVFLYDRVTGSVTIVSHAAGAPATTANSSSDSPVISADGAWVAFRSNATNLVPGQTDSNFALDVFLYERATGAVSLVSRAAGTTTTTGNNVSGPPTISGDGGIVAFPSSSTNLVVGQVDTNGAGDVFVFDRAADVLDLASRAAGTTTTTGNGGVTVTNAVAVSADGAFVGFSSGATNHVVGQTDTNATNDVFLFDRAAGTVALVSHAPGSATTATAGGGGSPSLSGDGSFVAFLRTIPTPPTTRLSSTPW
jgi:Tol biopolymer transport system component